MQKLTIFTLATAVCLILGCNSTKKESTSQSIEIPEPKYSLAQWSFNRDLFAGEMSTLDLCMPLAKWALMAWSMLINFS